MNNFRICVFGGTTEGRKFAEFLSEANINTDLFIATEYGHQFVKNLKNINIIQRRLVESEMNSLFVEKRYDYIVDATHPFAREVSENIANASNANNIKYLRIIRKSSVNKDCMYFNNFKDCIDYLKIKQGNILLTSGSKNLDEFTEIDDYQERIFVRILPMESSLKRCIELKYSSKNIICMQGPFSEELNTAMLNSIEAKYLVTKESSTSGGFEEKVEACKNTGAKCLVIRKAHEVGFTIEEICKLFMEKLL